MMMTKKMKERTNQVQIATIHSVNLGRAGKLIYFHVIFFFSTSIFLFSFVNSLSLSALGIINSKQFGVLYVCVCACVYTMFFAFNFSRFVRLFMGVVFQPSQFIGSEKVLICLFVHSRSLCILFAFSPSLSLCLVLPFNLFFTFGKQI